MLIPVTQMIWWEWSHHSSSCCIVDPIELWFSLWVGMARRYPFSHYCLIVASGHSPLSCASGHWSPRCSIHRTAVPSLAFDRLVPQPEPYVNKPCYHTASRHLTGWSHNPSHMSTSLAITWPRLSAESIWPPVMGARHSAWTATTQLCHIGRFNGSDKLTRSAFDHKSWVIFVVVGVI